MRLIVVGSPSVDLLHFKGRSEPSAGGAGLYTGLAAQRAGAEVVVVAPRPDPMPAELSAAATRLRWIGPTVAPDRLPHFEIEYTPDGDTVYHKAVQGAEGSLRPDHLPDLVAGDFAYVVPFIDPELQLRFARHLRERGVRVACGAYRGGIIRHRATVERVIEASDFFFCNEREAELLFGSAAEARVAPGKALFITRGARGARVLLGGHAADVPTVQVEELDPTGAGDTFCGTTLARIGAGDHPVQAARKAAAAAAEMVTEVGPRALLRAGAALVPPPDPRVRPDPEQIARVAPVIAAAPGTARFDFTGSSYPDTDDPCALDVFFAATLQQFGFWTSDEDRYLAPMIAPLAGQALKGSDYLWAAYRRWGEEAPGELTPAGQADLDAARFDHRLRDDSGANPLPAGRLHPEAAIAYGRDMTALGWSPASLLARTASSPQPLASFLAQLDAVGGYKEDPWRKKSALLAAILNQRPERFLEFGPGEDLPPIVDYHCMRSCLRLGLVAVLDEDLRTRLEARAVVRTDEEEAVRAACYEAMADLRRLSERSMGAVDWFFFQNRRRCPEMTDPKCAACPADPVCIKARDLFQPVFRTTAY